MIRALSRLSLPLLLAPVALAGTLHVDANLVGGAGDGSSWADAFAGPDGLQAALAVAVAGDEVWVAQGTYRPTPGTSRAVSFALKNGVTLYGSFLGTESSPDERPPFFSAPSVLSGDLNGDDGLLLFGDNSFHLLTTAGTDATAVLDGFEVRGGAATGAGGNNDRGGGILCVGGVSPTIRNCRFVANRCSFGGGAGYVSAGSFPSFTDCRFEDGDGGSFGGAFDIASGGPIVFERCRFSGNTAARAGAVEIFSTTGAVVDNCVFSGNTSTGNGGGGALWIGSGGNARVRNTTVTGNTSTNQAVAGVRVQNAANASIANCIIWDNTGPLGAQDSANQVNAAANVSYSTVQGGFAGTGNLALDPGFVDAPNGDYGLSPGSPAIDAGSNAELQPGVLLDVAGLPRQADVLAVPDTGEGTAPVVDQGAREVPSAWVGLGSALAGAAGEPVLLMEGTLEPSSPVSVSLSAAAGSATAWLAIGIAPLGLPFKGGTMVPDPLVLLPFATTPAGTFDLAASWPVGLPSGFPSWYQFWIVDAAGPKGYAASNGVKGTAP